MEEMILERGIILRGHYTGEELILNGADIILEDSEIILWGDTSDIILEEGAEHLPFLFFNLNTTYCH